MDDVLEQWQGPDVISYTSRLLDVPLRVHEIPGSQILPDKSCDIGSICFKGIVCVPKSGPNTGPSGHHLQVMVGVPAGYEFVCRCIWP